MLCRSPRGGGGSPAAEIGGQLELFGWHGGACGGKYLQRNELDGGGAGRRVYSLDGSGRASKGVASWMLAFFQLELLPGQCTGVSLAVALCPRRGRSRAGRDRHRISR